MNKPQRQSGIDELDWPQLHNKKSDIRILVKESRDKGKDIETQEKYWDQYQYICNVIATRMQLKANFKNNNPHQC